jgi:hypothetical protein
VADPNFSDIPLGGWAGTIEMVEQVDDQVTYEIQWDRGTLDGMHPVYKNRCERDGLDPETMWLGEEDIEPDDGTPVPIEQPTAIKTPALSEKDQDDRVRAVFGLRISSTTFHAESRQSRASHRRASFNLPVRGSLRLQLMLTGADLGGQG